MWADLGASTEQEALPEGFRKALRKEGRCAFAIGTVRKVAPSQGFASGQRRLFQRRRSLEKGLWESLVDECSSVFAGLGEEGFDARTHAQLRTALAELPPLCTTAVPRLRSALSLVTNTGSPLPSQRALQRGAYGDTRAGGHASSSTRRSSLCGYR